jgi:hypothetical protein
MGSGPPAVLWLFWVPATEGELRAGMSDQEGARLAEGEEESAERPAVGSTVVESTRTAQLASLAEQADLRCRLMQSMLAPAM